MKTLSRHQESSVDANELGRQVDAAIELLESFQNDRGLLAHVDEPRRLRLLQVAGAVARPDPWAKRELFRAARRKRAADKRAADEQVLARSGIREKRAEPVFVTPTQFPRPPVLAGTDLDRALAEAADLDRAATAVPAAEAHQRSAAKVIEPRSCYVCKCRYHDLHFFYDSLCKKCGDLNHAKRSQSADLSGRVALVTGARVKIGYQASIMLLRAGAAVIATTRFPRDAAARYAREPDWSEWGHRLEVHGLDLRHTPSVETFAKHLLQTRDRLDFILNNACQTVRKPSGFYDHLMAHERRPWSELPEREQGVLGSYESMRSEARSLLADHTPTARDAAPPASAAQAIGLHEPAALSQVALLADDLERGSEIFPEGKLDADLQQIDLRTRNSWRLSLPEVSAIELLEVQLVNAVAPFVLNARLKALMLAVPTRDKHIVNVSAMEGQFYRSFKTDKHPHTNMAKAALNMMTRTSAKEYVNDGIHMNSVDTGWITDEDPALVAARKTRDHGFHPPLDIVDGAARICDPIFSGFNTGKHVWGLFLKDYAPTDW